VIFFWELDSTRHRNLTRRNRAAARGRYRGKYIRRCNGPCSGANYAGSRVGVDRGRHAGVGDRDAGLICPTRESQVLFFLPALCHGPPRSCGCDGRWQRDCFCTLRGKPFASRGSAKGYRCSRGGRESWHPFAFQRRTAFRAPPHGNIFHRARCRNLYCCYLDVVFNPTSKSS